MSNLSTEQLAAAVAAAIAAVTEAPASKPSKKAGKSSTKSRKPKLSAEQKAEAYNEAKASFEATGTIPEGWLLVRSKNGHPYLRPEADRKSSWDVIEDNEPAPKKTKSSSKKAKAAPKGAAKASSKPKASDGRRLTQAEALELQLENAASLLKAAKKGVDISESLEALGIKLPSRTAGVAASKMLDEAEQAPKGRRPSDDLLSFAERIERGELSEAELKKVRASLEAKLGMKVTAKSGKSKKKG